MADGGAVGTSMFGTSSGTADTHVTRVHMYMQSICLSR